MNIIEYQAILKHGERSYVVSKTNGEGLLACTQDTSSESFFIALYLVFSSKLQRVLLIQVFWT